MTDPRTELVGRGYDVIGERFAEWRDRIVGDPRREWEGELVSRLQDGARVLELGCGAGVPDTQRLAARFRVTGVDISAEQVRRARAAVPEAEFVQADFTALELEPESFDAAVSFYAFNHVPRELLAPTFARIHRWLVPSGLLMTALGTGDLEAWTGEWLGAPTFFSSFPHETNTRLVQEAGFEILRDELVTFREPDGDATFQWVLAIKRAPSRTLRGIAAEDNQRLHEDNRAAWNEAAQAYADRIDETLASLRAGNSSLHPLERANLHDLADWCECAIHLQCASGRDTLSLWIEGAKRVVGIDISDRHIENAQRMAAELAAPATFHRCDVLDAPRELDGTADLVYTGRGALWWLHEIEAWAAVVYRLLKPGGMLHVLDDHPLSWLFDLDADQLTPSGYDYFSLEVESSQGWPASYLTLDLAEEQQALKHERHWTLAQIHQALVDTGLIVERLGEHPETYWPAFQNLADEVRRTIPNSFTIVARKPRT